jgi:hypothetical protein
MAINVTWNPRPQNAPMTVDVTFATTAVTAKCPSGGDQSIPTGGSYSCNQDILLMLIPGLDLKNLTVVTVTITTDTGAVLVNDAAVMLGPVVMNTADGAPPGYCSRTGTANLM